MFHSIIMKVSALTHPCEGELQPFISIAGPGCRGAEMLFDVKQRIQAELKLHDIAFICSMSKSANNCIILHIFELHSLHLCKLQNLQLFVFKTQIGSLIC